MHLLPIVSPVFNNIRPQSIPLYFFLKIFKISVLFQITPYFSYFLNFSAFKSYEREML